MLVLHHAAHAELTLLRATLELFFIAGMSCRKQPYSLNWHETWLHLEMSPWQNCAPACC